MAPPPPPTFPNSFNMSDVNNNNISIGFGGSGTNPAPGAGGGGGGSNPATGGGGVGGPTGTNPNPTWGGGLGGPNPNPNHNPNPNPTWGNGNVGGPNPNYPGAGGATGAFPPTRWPGPYPGVPTATAVPSSFFTLMSQPIGTAPWFPDSFLGYPRNLYVVSDDRNPFPVTQPVYAPYGFDTNNWYFLTVIADSLYTTNQIIFYEGDPSWIMQRGVQFGGQTSHGLLKLPNNIGVKYCVQVKYDRLPGV